MIQNSNFSKSTIVLISIAICSIWFVFDYRFAPRSTFYFIMGIKLLLILGIFFNTKLTKSTFNYTINYILLWVIVTEVLLNQNSPFKLFTSLLGSNLIIIFILPFYIQRQWKMTIFLKTYILFIFITVISIGFYQYFVGESIFDFYRFQDTSTIYNIENMRFTGLIYPDTTVAANALGIFSVYYFITNKFDKRNKLFNSIAYLIGFSTIAFTLTRASWAALIIVIVASSILIQKDKQKSNFSISASKIGSTILTIILFTIAILIFNFIFENYIVKGFSGEVNRLNSSDTFEYRLARYTLFITNSSKVLFTGFGVIQDPAESLRQIIGQDKWGTVHNQFFDFAISFGFLFTLFIYYRIVRAMRILVKYMQTESTNNTKKSFMFLVFSQLFVFLNEMAASNIYYFSILLLTISEIVINNINMFDTDKATYQPKEITPVI